VVEAAKNVVIKERKPGEEEEKEKKNPLKSEEKEAEKQEGNKVN
jgi:hypothetical protein